MIHRFLFWLTASLPCRLIDIEGKPYLERYGMPERMRALFKRLGFTVYLHRFVSGDSERHVHDHPWGWALAFVLTGSYIEQRFVGFDVRTGWFVRLRKVRFFNVLNRRSFHCIDAPKVNTWTLFVHGKRVKTWGFLKKIPEGTLYHQPFDVERSADWENNMPPGRDAGREPMVIA